MGNNKKYSKLIVTGSVAYDEIMVFPNEFKNFFQPDKLHQINVSFAVERLEKQIGGTGTNIAYNAHLLIGDKVQLFSAVGRDGDLFFEFLKKNKMNTSGILKDETLYTATGKVITDKLDNQIWGFYYGALEQASKIDLKKNIDSTTLIIVSANQEKAFLNFQNQAIKAGVDYIYDPGMALTWIKNNDLRSGVENAKYVVGNDYEISQLLKMLNLDKGFLKNKNIGLITTQGETGVCFQDGNTFLEVPGFKVDKVIDPTGAGDAWRAGFASGLIEGKPIIECLVQANALASFAVEKYGTVNHEPSRKELSDRISVIKKELEI